MPDRSASGPDSAGRWAFFRIGRSRVKLRIVNDPSRRLALSGAEPPFDLILDGRVAASGVLPERSVFHAPNQAFISMGETCRFRCAFCTLHLAPGGPGKAPDYWAGLIIRGVRERGADCAAVTAGVPGTVAQQVEAMAEAVSLARTALPGIPIGVEPYLEDPFDVDRLHDAGATEMKLNLQTATDAAYSRICPGLNRRTVLACLERACSVFGRGTVSSNIIVGLGESDEEILDAARRLAGIGAAANLRILRINELNRPLLTKALDRPPEPVPAERMARLADGLDAIFDGFGLDRGAMRTMCHRCRGCDL